MNSPESCQRSGAKARRRAALSPLLSQGKDKPSWILPDKIRRASFDRDGGYRQRRKIEIRLQEHFLHLVQIGQHALVVLDKLGVIRLALDGIARVA